METVVADAESLGDEVNKRLRTLRGSTLRNVALQKTDDGKFLVLLVLARPVYQRPGGR